MNRNRPEWLSYDQARSALVTGPAGKPGLSPEQAGSLLRDARNSPDHVLSLAHDVTVQYAGPRSRRWRVIWHGKLHIVTMPNPPWCELPPDDAYAWGVTLADAITSAETGVTTELRWPDGSVAAQIVPPEGPS